MPCQITGIDLAKAKETAANVLDQSVVVTTIVDVLMEKYYTAGCGSTGRYLIVQKDDSFSDSAEYK